MPCINVKIGRNLTDATRVAVADAVAECIVERPGKSRANTMIQVDTDRYIRMGDYDACIFVDARVFGPAPLASKQAFESKLSARLAELTGIPVAAQYYNITEMPSWGSNGKFFE